MASRCGAEASACLGASATPHGSCRRINTGMRSGRIWRADSATASIEQSPEAGQAAQAARPDAPRDRRRPGRAVRGMARSGRAQHTAARHGPTEPVSRGGPLPTAFGRMQLGPAVSPDGTTGGVLLRTRSLLARSVSGDVTPAASCASLPRRRRARVSTACSRCDRPARGVPMGAGSRFAAVRQGHAALVILDMRRPAASGRSRSRRSGRFCRSTWSPDGGRWRSRRSRLASPISTSTTCEGRRCGG